MATRFAKRAGITDEQPVTVSFGFSSFAAAMVVSLLEEIPLLGPAITFVTFGLHRIVLVTEEQTRVFRARPLHRPGQVLKTYPVAPGTVTRVRGKLTFSDGAVVWHSPLLAQRAARVEEAANAGAPTTVAPGAPAAQAPA